MKQYIVLEKQLVGYEVQRLQGRGYVIVRDTGKRVDLRQGEESAVVIFPGDAK